MRPAIGERSIYSVERDARIPEGDARIREMQAKARGDGGDAGLLKKARTLTLHRGDVVWITEGRRGEHVLARVVGLPGDHVRTTRNGAAIVNGKPEREHYRHSYASSEAVKTKGVFLHDFGEVLVPRGHIYCLTDRRGASENKKLGLKRLREVRGKLVLGPRDRGEED